MIESETARVVIDTGPDFRQQMLRESVPRMDGIVFTHPHKDHIAGMDDIRSFNFRQREDMDVYANALTQKALKREFYYVFEAVKYPGVPAVELHEIDDDTPFEVAGIPFLPIPVMHHKMPVLGFRIGNLAYVTDANFISEKSMARLQGLDVLILNALRRKKHLSHFNVEEALEIVDQLRPKQTWFTHISHLLGHHADVDPTLPDHVSLAYDGLQVQF